MCVRDITSIREMCWFDENDPHRLIVFEYLVPVDGTVWEGLEGVVLLGETHHLGGMLRGFKRPHFSRFSLPGARSQRYLWI